MKCVISKVFYVVAEFRTAQFREQSAPAPTTNKLLVIFFAGILFSCAKISPVETCRPA